MTTSCRVWAMYQARCHLCNWLGEILPDPESAAYDAREHRRAEEHRARLKRKGR